MRGKDAESKASASDGDVFLNFRTSLGKIIYQLDKTGFSQVFSDDGSLPVFKGLLLGMVEEFLFGALQKDFLYPTRS